MHCTVVYNDLRLNHNLRPPDDRRTDIHYLPVYFLPTALYSPIPSSGAPSKVYISHQWLGPRRRTQNSLRHLTHFSAKCYKCDILPWFSIPVDFEALCFPDGAIYRKSKNCSGSVDDCVHINSEILPILPIFTGGVWISAKFSIWNPLDSKRSNKTNL